MSISETRIANMALTFLGATPITSLDDQGSEGKIVNIHFEQSRDAALEAREWTFAVKRTDLAALTEGPNWGFGQAFQIPADTLRILEVRDDMQGRVNYQELMNSLNWRREGDQIVTDAQLIRIRYLARITDPARYTAAFVQAFAARLAMDIAVGLTQSRAMFNDMAALYAAKIREAAATDGMQGRIQVMRSSKLTGVRGVGASAGGGFASGTVLRRIRYGNHRSKNRIGADRHGQGRRHADGIDLSDR